MAKKSHEQFIEDMARIAPSISILGRYQGSSKAIRARCDICGHVWEPIASNLISGHGCPKCAIKRRASTARKSQDVIEKEIKDALPDVRVIGEYRGASAKLEVVCERCGHTWSALPTSLKRGHGCPICCKSGTSFSEQFILLAIAHCYDGEVVSRDRKSIGKELDILIPEKGLAIEIGAWHWHEKSLDSDLQKRNLCNERGIRLITIYDSCSLDAPPKPNDWFIYEHDLAQQENFVDLIALCKFIIGELGESANCNWEAIGAAARERSLMMTLESFEKRLKEVNPRIECVEEYSGIMQDATVRCKVCNKSWTALAMSLLSGHGCPYCSGRRILPGKNDLMSQCPSIAKEWHVTKNSLEDPSCVHVFSGKKAWWICPQGHEYEAVISNRTKNGTGCPYCSGNKVLAGYNDLTATNPELVSEWDDERNAPLKPSNVSAGSNKRVFWLCKYGHSFQARVADRATRSVGCPYCSGAKVLVGFNDLATVNPSLAAEWDYEMNDPLSPEEVKAGSGKRVWWQCSRGHKWMATINSRHRGAGCPYCSNKKVLPGFNDLATVNPALASEWMESENGGLMPDHIVAGSAFKAWWKCASCGCEWQAKVCNRNKGARCPSCNSRPGE